MEMTRVNKTQNSESEYLEGLVYTTVLSESRRVSERVWGSRKEKASNEIKIKEYQSVSFALHTSPRMFCACPPFPPQSQA